MLNALVALAVSLFTPQTQVVDQTLVQHVLDVSVVIRAKESVATEAGPKLMMIGCSGTFIKEDTVLTAAHCFESTPYMVWVRGPKGGSHRASVLKCDFKHDLALLHVIGPKHVSVTMASAVKRGEAVVNMGSPLFFEFLLSEGIVASEKCKVRGFDSLFTITTAMINPGSSGGGAFNSKGELIGVNTLAFGFFGWTGITGAVDIGTIKEFLK